MKRLLIELKSLWENQYALNVSKEVPGKVTEKEWAEIEQARSRSNIQRVILFTFILLFVQIANLLLNYFTDFHDGFNTAYSLGSLYFLAVCFVYLVLIGKYIAKSKNVKKGRILSLSFWGFYIAGSLVFCYLELVERKAFTNFVLMMAAIAVIPVLNRKELMAFGGIGFAAEGILLFLVGSDAWEYIQLCVMIAAIAYAVSHMLYASFINVNIVHKQLEKMAQTDSLTNLLNRRGFEKRLESIWKQSVRNKSRVMVSMVDIDFFKSFNDEFGHDAGDQCLMAIAESIALDFKRATDVVARFGGEEFVLFATDLSDEKIIGFMNAITARVEAMQIPAGETSVSNYVTVSIGSVSAQAAPEMSFERLYKKADRELSKSKNSGKNSLSFNGTVYKNRREHMAERG